MKAVRKIFTFAVILVCLLLAVPFCQAAPISQATARQVAGNTIAHHMALFGDWGGYYQPRILEGEPVAYHGKEVAFNFTVYPSGHILVAADDDLEPVLLYSATSNFDPRRVDDPRSIERVILEELANVYTSTKKYLAAVKASGRALGVDMRIERKNRAWDYFLHDPGRSVATASGWKTARLKGSVISGLPVSSIWEQSYPYNIKMPENDCLQSGLDTDNTLAGCVAVAWGQILYYWKWPLQGTGSHSYTWNGTQLSANFEHEYKWSLMQDQILNDSSLEAKEAVSELLYDLGVAAEMDYGCDSSGSASYADDVLDDYFKYRSDTIARRSRADYSAAEWFNLFVVEFSAEPQRPVALSIFTSDGAGHEVVADGYQSGSSDLIHINFGWGGYYDGYYAITEDFSAYDTWEADTQVAVVGIEPDNNPPQVDAGADQEAEVGQEVILDGSVVDPENVGIDYCYWKQLTGPGVTLKDEGGTRRSFIAPQVSADKELRFMLKAADANRAVAVDYCTVTIHAPSNSGSNTPSSSGGGGGGGCFIGSVSP